MFDDKQINIFVSYSHKDEEFKDELYTHLSLLRRNGVIDDWNDRKIMPGQNFGVEIDKKIDDSDIFIILVSPDFVASDYCYDVELKKAIDLYESGRIIIIPIVIRTTDWKETPFSNIQALPRDAKSINSWEDRDQAWLDVVDGLKKTIKEISEKK